MKKALELQLKEKYPELFKLSSEDHDVCECEKGWYGLIDGLCERLMAVEGRPNEQSLVRIRVRKGVMVLHVAPLTPEAWEIALDVREEAKAVCELCGKPGEVREKHHPDKSQMYVRCDYCHEHRR